VTSPTASAPTSARPQAQAAARRPAGSGGGGGSGNGNGSGNAGGSGGGAATGASGASAGGRSTQSGQVAPGGAADSFFSPAHTMGGGGEPTGASPMGRAKARATGVLGQLKRLLRDKVGGSDGADGATRAPASASLVAA